MSFQYVFDNATSLAISKQKTVAQTVSRNGVVKTTSLGGQTYEFRVELPGGRYSDNRRLIELADSLDRTTEDTVAINKAAHSYITGYQGDLSETSSSITVSYSSGNTLTITGGDSGLSAGEFKFKAGDYIQLQDSPGHVYTITADVPHDSTTITVHRPIKETAGTYTLNVGQDVSWRVICVSLPTWTIIGHDQVSWSGPFVFAEAV